MEIMESSEKETLLQNASEFKKANEKLTNYLTSLLESRLDLINKIDAITERDIKPLKDSVSQVDSEIESIMMSNDIDKHTVDGYGAHVKFYSKTKILDMEKAIKWASNNLSVLKKDIFKQAEIDKLIDDGRIPIAETDGVDCNDSYKKVMYRRR